MATERFAKKYLSKSAIKNAEIWKNYYCYRGEWEYEIFLFDLLHHHEDLFEKKFLIKGYTIAEKREEFMENLSRHRADYLIECGIKPLKKQYKQYLVDIETAKMKEAKNPDLIIFGGKVCCDIREVTTADHKIYFVDEKSYQKICEKKFESDNPAPLLLSRCKIREFDMFGLY